MIKEGVQEHFIFQKEKVVGILIQLITKMKEFPMRIEVVIVLTLSKLCCIVSQVE